MSRIMKGNVIFMFWILIAFGSTVYATSIDLSANFRLFGEVNRFSALGFGDMFVSFGVSPTGGAISGSERGRIEYSPGSSGPITTGVLAPLNLPAFGWQVVDFTFSLPFLMEIDQEASMFVGLGTNFIGSAAGASGSKQVIFDFSDNTHYFGLLGFTPDQGLSLLSITLADGTSLADAGLKFDFISENTVLSAFASASDDRGQIAPVISIATPPNRAAVFPFGGTATSKIQGPFTNALVNLDVNPEPNPLVFDLAGASVGGANNIKLTRLSQPVPDPIPEPNTVGLLGLGLAGLICVGCKRGCY